MLVARHPASALRAALSVCANLTPGHYRPRACGSKQAYIPSRVRTSAQSCSLNGRQREYRALSSLRTPTSNICICNTFKKCVRNSRGMSTCKKCWGWPLISNANSALAPYSRLDIPLDSLPLLQPVVKGNEPALLFPKQIADQTALRFSGIGHNACTDLPRCFVDCVLRITPPTFC
jgi:hypothetical protein